jgi:3-oxoadipate enol-lactonase
MLFIREPTGYKKQSFLKVLREARQESLYEQPRGGNMPKIKVNDISMYYEVHGQGELLVLINGAGAGIEMLSRLIPIYSRDYRLVLFDNRGVGRTDKPEGPYTTQLMADDLAGLLDRLNIDSAHIHGTSMGGMIAQEFALRHPHKVKALILAVTHCGGAHSILPESDDMSRISKLPPRAAAEAMLRLCITEKFISEKPESFQRLLAFTVEHPFVQTSLQNHAQAVAGHNTCDRLPEITAPTLILAGDADRVVPVGNSRILTTRIPDAELVIFKDAGHMLVEAGDEPHRAAIDFLKRRWKEN